MSVPEILVGGDLAIEPEKMQFPIGTTDAPIVKQAKAGGVTLDEILVHENFLTQFTVLADAHAGAILWSQQIGPQQLMSRVIIGNQAHRQHTRVSLISSMYQYWCGDLKFRFRFTKTILQQCKLIACYIPGLRAGEAPPNPQLLVDYQFSTVMNPANESLGELIVPFICNANWLPVNEYTGRIVVGLVSPLVSSENVRAELPIMVTVSAGDLKFRSLVTPSRLEPEGDGGGGGGGVGSSDAPALFAESCSRVTQTERGTNSGFLFSMESDASASEYTYALPLTRRDILGAEGGVAGFADRLARMRPTNECSPTHAVLAPQATYLNACPAFKRVCTSLADTGIGLDNQLALMPAFFALTTGPAGTDEIWLYFRIDSTRDMPLPRFEKGECDLTAWSSSLGTYQTWKPLTGVFGTYTSPGTQQRWMTCVVTRTEKLSSGPHKWSLDGVAVPLPSFMTRLTSELNCWSTETDEYSSLLLYCTGPLILNDKVRAHLLQGTKNSADSVAVSFTTCQGARIFQGDRLNSQTRFLFKFFYNLFGGNQNSPWAKVCVVADRLCSFGLSLFLGYDGTPAPIPLTPETRMQLTSQETDHANYPKQTVTVPTSQAVEYNNKMELFFSRQQKRSEARRRRRQRLRAGASGSLGDQQSNTDRSSSSDADSEASVH